MNGAHDLGGMHGFGPVEYDSAHVPFHSAWEGRVQGMMVTTLARGLWSAHAFRHANERMHPAHYLYSRYFERFLFSLERNVVECGIATAREVWARVEKLRAAPDDAAIPRWEDPAFAGAVLERLTGSGVPTAVPLDHAPQFDVGQHVRTTNDHPSGHTRLPRYARGRRGCIESVIGGFPLPDSHSEEVERAEYCYVVAFEGQELWGADAEPGTRVHLDLWDSHLRPWSEDQGGVV